MVETFSARDAVELAIVERSGFVESRHTGSAVVVTADGTLRAELGDVEAPVLVHAPLNPFRAVACLAAGVQATDEQVAISVSTHGGTPGHVALVRDVLASAGLDDRALACPAGWPSDQAARDALVRAGEPASPVYTPASGSHAAMAAACVAQGWSIADVLDVEHPLQQSIRETVERLASARPLATAIDAAGAPVLALPLVALARGIARLRTANPASPFAMYRHSARVASAALAHGWVVDGHGRPDTVVIDELGTLARTGTEGVLVMSAPDGTTVALKALDGSSRALTLVGLQLLVAAGSLGVSDVQRIVARLGLEVLGAGVPVGAVRVGADVPLRL
ncbi:asparaginase [Pseudoclavibacter chungangensis]|uniref:Asparaginase n=1 Tax=Pseudoclavibacter chungangensis TaxID=587635 RepID=A0A7J5BSM0_9MICO|nr:asparaginase [Pseudoclavibacter chungangensis]KAB1657310.1 asparaginase [Pseudoclavibacter chungangensis]